MRPPTSWSFVRCTFAVFVPFDPFLCVLFFEPPSGTIEGRPAPPPLKKDNPFSVNSFLPRRIPLFYLTLLLVHVSVDGHSKGVSPPPKAVAFLHSWFPGTFSCSHKRHA